MKHVRINEQLFTRKALFRSFKKRLKVREKSILLILEYPLPTDVIGIDNKLKQFKFRLFKVDYLKSAKRRRFIHCFLIYIKNKQDYSLFQLLFSELLKYTILE